MHSHTRSSIRDALIAVRDYLQKVSPGDEKHWVYNRDPTSGNWVGTLIPKSVLNKSAFHTITWTRLVADIANVLAQEYPNYVNSQIYVGKNGCQFTADHLGNLATIIWDRYGTFVVDDTKIDALLDELAAFFDEPSIELQLLAPVSNFTAPVDLQSIKFPGGLTLRPLTSEEATKIYGGSLDCMNMSKASFYNMPCMVLEGSISATKYIGPQAAEKWQQEMPSTDVGIRKKLETAMLAISSFKAGGIAYDGYHLTPKKFCPIPIGGSFHPYSEWVPPMGNFSLSNEEIEAFSTHVGYFESLHSSLEFACRRLLDAERRQQARDRILDAVIGLEAVLLQKMTDDKKYRGEITYRLSMNYASMFDAPDKKYQAFKTARDLYCCRSEIGHGESVADADKRRINGKDMLLSEIGSLAVSILRDVIKNFLPNGSRPIYLEDGFWMKKIFGV